MLFLLLMLFELVYWLSVLSFGSGIYFVVGLNCSTPCFHLGIFGSCRA